VGIYKSLTDTHECRNWERGRAVSFLGEGGELIPLQTTCSETGSKGCLIGLWKMKYIAVRCLTGWTKWILDKYISNFKKSNPPTGNKQSLQRISFICEYK
jgi:hypothetical protein